MNRQKAAPPGDGLPRAANHEPDGSPATPTEARRSARARAERPGRGGRLRAGPGREIGRAILIRPTVTRTHRLILDGELGRDSAVALEAEIDALCDAGVDELVLDLGGLRSIDPTGARVLAMRCELCRRRGVRVELASVDGEARRALRAAGLGERLAAAESPDKDENAPRKTRKIV